MLHITEHSMSGTCRKTSVVLNGGSGRSRMSTFTKILFNMPFRVEQMYSGAVPICNSLDYLTSVEAKRCLKEKRPKLDWPRLRYWQRYHEDSSSQTL